MKALVAAPLIPISRALHAHRAAQGVIYADQILCRTEPKYDVRVNMTGPSYVDDFNEYDVLYVYHGNDWSGSINLFGGVKGFPYVRNFVNFSRFRGEIVSLIVDFPSYGPVLKEKVSKGKEYDPLWDEVDWSNLDRMERQSVTMKDPNPPWWAGQAIGDSHAICLYRRGWNVRSVPFKTLHGALKEGLTSFVTVPTPNALEFYFGNIDVRHHLCRMTDRFEATVRLAIRYFEQALDASANFMVPVGLYELLPIENESRVIPKSGWYKGAPFHGTWAQRNEVRRLFNKTLKSLCETSSMVNFVEWVPSSFYNSKGELSFDVMEKPRSVHLSRAYYPYWQGKEYNGIEEAKSLEEFFE